MALFLPVGKHVLQRWENQSGFMETDIRTEAWPLLKMEIKIESETRPDIIKDRKA